jgi:hypothetical protein
MNSAWFGASNGLKRRGFDAALALAEKKRKERATQVAVGIDLPKSVTPATPTFVPWNISD